MTDLVHDSDMVIDVILRDGTTLRLRAPVDGRRAGARSTSSRTSRSGAAFSASTGSASRATGSCAPSSIRTGPRRARSSASWATTARSGSSRSANYVRLRDPHTAEAAFAVADDFQEKGIGTRLLEQLAPRAAAHGIEAFIAEVLPENRAMLSVFENVGFVPHAHARRRRRRGPVPDRRHHGLPGARGRARPRRRHRLAATVLRAEHGRRRRRLGAARLDRRAHLPQHPRPADTPVPPTP